MRIEPGERPMDDPKRRSQLSADLAQVDKHIAQGQERIARQRELIAIMERQGQVTDEANDLLALLCETQERHAEHRDRLLRELRGGRLRAAAMPTREYEHARP